ncbi:MAG: hypothetical protein ACRDD7_08930 [Peptostreptococcaceae bacterium]
MKKYTSGLIIPITIAIVMIGFMKFEVSALPYYDLKFEQVSSKIVKGEYENLEGIINLNKTTKVPMIISKSYEPIVSVDINKDEIDAIGQVLGSGWNECVLINKEEEIEIKKKKNTYIQVRPLYKEIKGNLLQDYTSWSKSKEITILIPIDVEYTLKVE